MRRWKTDVILPIVLLSALAGPGCSPAPQWPYVVELGATKLNVEVAITPDELTRGLMYRDELGSNWGMLFVYDSEQPLGFWMKNTRVPLSIAFIDRARVVRDIKDMAPETEDVHRSSVPVMYALEVNRGWFAKHGVEVGSTVKFSTGLEEYIAHKR